MSEAVIVLLVFLVAYVCFALIPNRRAVVACLGAALLVATGVVGWHEAVFEDINWNVIGLFFGTLILAELFMQSKMPAVIAEVLVQRTHTVRGAMLVICVLSSVLSMLVENVAVVLLIAPIAISLTRKLNISPVRLLIMVAVCSNIQGTATMIGDPPSMILAGFKKMGFFDFFVYQGRPGIFFAVQVGAALALIVQWRMLREFHGKIDLEPTDKVLSVVPGCLMVLLMAGLTVSTMVDPDFTWYAGTLALAIALGALVWYRLGPRWTRIRDLVRTLDWDTTFFLMGIFVIVEALSKSGWIDRVSAGLTDVAGGSALAAYSLILVVSLVVSGFVDNVPFLLVMLPVVEHVSRDLGASDTLLAFGLLVGASFGGNLTPIGASANVVTLGILKREGHPAKFRTFCAVGVPLTIVAAAAAGAFVWLFWSP